MYRYTTRQQNRRRPWQGFLLLALAALPCTQALGDGAAPAPQGDERIWPGLVPPAKKHVASRLPQIDALQKLTGGVLFIGDSITEGAPLFAMFPGVSSANCGIGWDTSDGLLLRLDQIRRNNPQRAFVLIGTNDLGYGHTPEHIAGNVILAVDRLSADMPETEFYVISILPREAQSNAAILESNEILASATGDHGYVYLDLASHTMAPDGTLRAELTFDNLHLNVHGYSLWSALMENCVRMGCGEL